MFSKMIVGRCQGVTDFRASLEPDPTTGLGRALPPVPRLTLVVVADEVVHALDGLLEARAA